MNGQDRFVGGFIAHHENLLSKSKKHPPMQRNGIHNGEHRTWNDTGKEFTVIKPVRWNKWQVLDDFQFKVCYEYIILTNSTFKSYF